MNDTQKYLYENGWSKERALDILIYLTLALFIGLLVRLAVERNDLTLALEQETLKNAFLLAKIEDLGNRARERRENASQGHQRTTGRGQKSIGQAGFCQNED